jgi:YD repeat-containing protein
VGLLTCDSRVRKPAPEQLATSNTYDNANRLTQITQGSAEVSFTYDNANRRSSLTLSNGIIVTYSYDNASQLTGLTYTYDSNTLGNVTYAYDLAGRRTAIGGTYARSGLPSAISTTAYNANNQLTTWGTASLYYDDNGNMTADGTNSFVWNGRGLNFRSAVVFAMLANDIAKNLANGGK